ncbi:MAG TPA: hypothetical protein VKR61_15725 [Bryobacteraceae bacterium]|nr:hypothetical protein [Bryobacteraceae bacterium]
MRKWIWPAAFLAMALLFFIANRGAYKGFFSADELDSIGWTPQIPVADFVRDLVNPVYNARNFRPVGHLYFRFMSRAFGLDFRRYLLPLHLLHLLNVWLLWLVLSNLGASRFAAGAGALFFAFQMAVFDVYWKPMYAFDLFCAAFCLLSLLAWIKRRWVLSFVAFWLAYKSKELAVMLPAVFACYELWFGQRRWKPLIPFLAVSLSFGLQGIFLNPNEENLYAFRFTPAAVISSARFYAAALLGIPFAGFALLALPVVRRNRLMWLGLAVTALFFVPLLFLPGRLFSAYWYVPLTGVVMMFASLADGRFGFLAAVFLAAWIPWTYLDLREYRSRKLAEDADDRAYIEQLRAAAPTFKGVPLFLYHGLPPALSHWGAAGALRYLLPDTNVKVAPMDDPAAASQFQSLRLATLVWVQPRRHLWIAVRTPETLDTTYVSMNEVTPVWQLTDGWYALEEGYRWAAPRATARLYRAPRAAQFELVVNIGPQLLNTIGHSDLSVRLNSVPLGTAHITDLGIRIVRWPLPPGPAGPVEVELLASPAFHASGDPRTLGDAIMSFGFLPSGR